ncbi:hypothetical protein GYMLUDRAFT_43655 [Collybiopsis luxurians FD-317 M1]|uniref:Zn(2)-C6 fungal-type domain-containing protein n=1 Tax=Collybiopsis luxurians FD-317 M1 TaxID=944289 RepID=A0A0D0BXC8_9AGAR|nr:hypothetical protein GYMLUDRAFT_43655 [Collybiopsis luxurians FD-317 M1]
MSRNFDHAYPSSHRAASYHPHVQVNIPSTSTSSSPSSYSHRNMGSGPANSQPLPLQLVPAPPPDRPKRKRLAKACDACHKSKRRCDGTAPCSNCYFASKPCTYTDASGRAVPAPRVAAAGPANAPQHVEFVNSGPHTGVQDAHPNTRVGSSRAPPPSSYGHAGPPYYLPPPSLPPLQSQSPSQHQRPYPQFSSSTSHSASRREWDGGVASSSTLTKNQGTQSRKRPRKDSPEKSRESLDRDKENDQEKDTHSQSSNIRPVLVGGYAARPSIELEPALTRELTNLFFTHSHPMVMIIHKPSFTNAVTMNQVPMYLLYAVCALASRHSKQPSLAASPRRLSGRHFADEAVRLMFSARKRSSVMGWPGDSAPGTDASAGNGHGEDPDHAKRAPIDELYNGDLVLPASLYTAQALCLLAMYEILATKPNSKSSHHNTMLLSGSDLETDLEPIVLSPRGERFRELSLQMLQELGVHKPQFPLLTPVPSQAWIEESIEKECIRRIFWLIYIIDCLRGIYYQGEGPLLGGSGRGYQPRGRPHAKPLSQSVAAPEDTTAKSSYLLSDPHKSSDVTSVQPLSPAPISGGSSFHNPSPSFSPPIRAFSNGFLGFTEAELRVRLPVDETSFEMGVVYECMPEYLYLPSPPAPSSELPVHKTSASGSEIAQTIRILSVYHKIERTLDELYQAPSPVSHSADEKASLFSSTPTPSYYQDRAALQSALEEDRKLFMVWDQGVHPHLRWDDSENVFVQKSMLETNSNTGAWCFCLIAMLEASCIMGLGVGSRALQWGSVVDPRSKQSNEDFRNTLKELDDPGPDWWKASHRKKNPGETDLDWGVRRLDAVVDKVGERAGSSVIMGAWLWPLIKYLNRDDEKIQKGLDIFEEFCGVRMDILDKLTKSKWGFGSESIPIPASAVAKNPSIPKSTPEDPSRIVDTEMSDVSAESQQDERPMPDTLASNSPASVASTSGPGTENHLPMLQTQTSLPSLKSSGLLDWSSRSSHPSNPASTSVHHHSQSHSHGLPHLNIGTGAHSNYITGSASPASGMPSTPTVNSIITPTPVSMATPTTTTMAMATTLPTSIPSKAIVSAEIASSPLSAGSPSGSSSAQQGRSGLSWMMNG